MTEITIYADRVKKAIPNFYNNIHFHPTDAIEDSWGRKILEEIHKDDAVRNIRLYTMFEDMVSMDHDGNLQYDFSLNDKRMDLLVECGFRLIVTYCFMPVCISSRPDAGIEKNRYKKKGYNSFEPADYMKWREICREYTAHIVDRYGIEEVGKWYLECWNEPDAQYWMKGEDPDIKISSYLRLYEHFARGVQDVNKNLKTGGPAACGGLPESLKIAEALVKSISGGNKVDFISYHTYSISPAELNKGVTPELMLNINKIKKVHEIISENGQGDLGIIIDEWESVWGGPTGIDDIPEMNYRNSEYFSAAYARMIDLCINELIMNEIPLEMIMLCLSGQHDLRKDFQGTRNFITLSGYKKPIYNAYVLTNRLGDELLDYDISNSGQHIGIIPTKGNGLKFLIYHMSENINADLGDREVIVRIPDAKKDFAYKKHLIDGNNSNSFAQWKKTPDEPDAVIDASIIKVCSEKAEGNAIRLCLGQNAVCLIEVAD